MSSCYHLLLFISSLFLVPSYASLTFSGNLSAPIGPHGWQFRTVTVYDTNFLSQNASGDVFTGAFFNSVAYLPFAFVSHFSSSSGAPDINTGKDFRNASVGMASGYMGVAALRIDELAPNGTVVLSRSLLWTPAATYIESEDGDSSPNLRKFTFAATGNAIPAWKLSITYVLSQIAGVLDQSIPVVPLSLTSVVEVGTWSYMSPNNSLSLVLVVGSGPNQAGQKGMLVSTDGQVYLSLNKMVTYSGGRAEVGISSFTPFTDRLDTPYLSTQLAERYGSAASINQVAISFPPGASGILYSYSFGTGEMVKDGDWNITPAATTSPSSSSSSSSSSPTLKTSLLLLSLISLFVCKLSLLI